MLNNLTPDDFEFDLKIVNGYIEQNTWGKVVPTFGVSLIEQFFENVSVGWMTMNKFFKITPSVNTSLQF